MDQIFCAPGDLRFFKRNRWQIFLGGSVLPDQPVVDGQFSETTDTDLGAVVDERSFLQHMRRDANRFAWRADGELVLEQILRFVDRPGVLHLDETLDHEGGAFAEKLGIRNLQFRSETGMALLRIVRIRTVYFLGHGC